MTPVEYNIWQARELAQKQMKVRHNMFTDEEYVTYTSTGTLIDENGIQLPEDEFWKLREQQVFQNGWRVVE
jgi:hypothetical protein